MRHPAGREREGFRLDFVAISRRLKALELPEVGVVVGIGGGGIVLAALLAHQLERPMTFIAINYRDGENRPRRLAPEILSPPPVFDGHRHLLLVDDVSVSGATLEVAKRAFEGHEITTVVLKGRADIVLFPELSSCIALPWRDG